MRKGLLLKTEESVSQFRELLFICCPSHVWGSSGLSLGTGFVLLYILPLGSIFKKNGIPYHLYAVDLQINLPLKSNDQLSIQSLYERLAEVGWLTIFSN